MPDIIGTPVERVIPEGWSVLRSAEVAAGDAMESGGKWAKLVYQERREKTDANGRLWGTHLVIRRNAPEPSVEELRQERDAWKCSCKINADNIDRLIGEREELKAKVAELEKAAAAPCATHEKLWREERETLEAKLAALTKDRDEWKDVAEVQEGAVERARADNQVLHAKVADLESDVERWKGMWTLSRNKHQGALDAKDAEIDRLKADVHMWSEANQANLARADAADAKMCSGFQAEVDRLKAEAEQLKRDLKASQARFCVLTQEADRMAAKLVAVRKAMGGA